MCPRLLLTRPRPESQRFLRMLQQTMPHLRAVISPLIDIVLQPPPPDVADTAGGLIFTSLNGVRGFVKGCARRDLPVWCVGARTASRARAAGFTQIHTASGDARALLDLLTGTPSARSPRAAPLLHLRGAHVAAPIAARLVDLGLPARDHVVYDQQPVPLDSAAAALMAGADPVVAPIFSPRTARLFVAELEALSGPSAELHVVAISDAAAAPLTGLEAVHLSVADQPNAEAVMQLTIQTIRALEAMDKPR